MAPRERSIVSPVIRPQGWCPGALRPMPSGDGLIVRLRFRGGALLPDLGEAIAEWSEAFGNGLIDLTNRANLQLRGVTDETLRQLQDALAQRGLLDDDPAAEAVRNVMASPLAGFDPSTLLDIRPCIEALEEALRKDPVFHALPAKFGFLIGDGGRLAVAAERADIAFIATPSGDSVRFMVYLGGEPAGVCAIEDLVIVAARLAQRFLRLRDRDVTLRRMASLVEKIGLAELIAPVGLTPLFTESATIVAAPRPIGHHDLGRYQALGVGVPFGRLTAVTLRTLSEEASKASGELRLTPWRAVLVVGESLEAHAGERLREAGLLLDDAAPISGVAACPGAPACRSGSTSTHEDGLAIAPWARHLGTNGITIHVSGCAKGCAHSRKAPVTLVGRDGRYDLVLNGRAGDAPSATRLELPGVMKLLAALAERQLEGARPWRA